MKKGKFSVKSEGGKTWAYVQRSPGKKWTDAPLHQRLRWIVQQVNLGNVITESDNDDEVVSISIGRAGGAPAETAHEEVAEAAKIRLMTVNLHGVLATSRERGIEPEFADFAESLTATARDAAYRNTEFHYAFQLIDVLQRIGERTFTLESLPLLGRASKEAVDLLGEATRCHLFGLDLACIALCRACVEACLKEKTPPGELLQERMNSGNAGELECIINAAGRLKLLDDHHRQMAHQVRRSGNIVMHRQEMREGGDASSEVLLRARAVVSHLFATA